jgi:aryl-alcohol dehydrogenase
MQAAVVFERSGPLRFEQLELDEPGDDEVLVCIVGVGICHTDLAGQDGHLPIPPLPASLDTKGRASSKR